MTCDSAARLIPLYYYGELPPDDEEQVEDHLHGCPACSRQMEGQRQLAAALDRRTAEPPPFLVEECRLDLMAAVQSCDRKAAEIPRAPAKGPWTLFLEALASTVAGFTRVRVPLGAVALIAVGFLAGKFVSGPGGSPKVPSGSPSDGVYATVRSVQADPGGGVKIAYDETRRREISGRMDDQNIRRMLLAGAREDNPAVRVESVGVLNDRASSSDVRDALLSMLVNDPAAPVRMKALEGLKPLADDPQVRRTLARVLLSDDYPAVRMQAVDLLVAHPDDSMVGVFQGLVQREKDPYVRLKFEKALKDWNASVGTF